MSIREAKAASVTILVFLFWIVPCAGDGVSFVVTDTDFVDGVYDFHYYTHPNTAPVATAKRTVINGVDQGISDPTIMKPGWGFGDAGTPDIGYWAAIGPSAAANTSGTITMGWDFTSVSGRIARVELKTRHILFQFSPYTVHAVGDTIAAHVATPAGGYGTAPYTQLYSYTGNGDSNTVLFSSQSILDINPFLSDTWLNDPGLLEFKFTYTQTPNPTIPGRHIEIFRDDNGTGDDGFLLRVTLAANVTIDGPASGFVDDLLSFSAGCSDESLRTGWTWSAPGGTIRGQADARAIAVSWPSPGTYSLSASHPSCTDAPSPAMVSISTRGAKVVVGEAPEPIVQNENVAGGTTSYLIRNVGDAVTSISLAQTGNFFSQTPSSFTLSPGASQRVTITGLSRGAGVYEGASLPSGGGVPAGAEVAIRLLSAATSPPDVGAVPDGNRIDTSGPAGGSSSASVTFRNEGSTRLQGVVTGNQRWIRPESGVIEIEPGQTRSVNFTVDRSRRPDVASPLGSVFGDLTLTWSGFGASGKSTFDSVPTLAVPVTVSDTVPPSTEAAQIPPLGEADVAFFIPGVGHITGSVGVFLSDLSIVNLTRGETVENLSFYFNPIGGSAGAAPSASLASVVPNQPVALSDLVSSVFGSTSQLGSLQLRTNNPLKIALSANVFNASNPAGTYGTIIPTVRSDRGAGPGGSVYLAGLRSDATSHTNLYIQEMSGAEVRVRTEFLGTDGAVSGTRDDVVPGFGLVQIGAVVPAGAVSAVLTSTGETGRFFAYATPVDKLSGDTWSVSDWPRQYGYSRGEAMIFPVAGSVRGANDTFFRTDVAILNTSADTTASGTLRYVSREGQVFERELTIPARSSSILDDVTGSFFAITGDTVGYIVWLPAAGEVVMTSRNYTTAAGQAASFGSAVPALAVAQSLRLGDLRRMAGLDDAALATIQSGRPASFRTNFGLMETSGNAATVRVTIRYDVNGSLALARESGFIEYTLAPNQFMQVNNLARAILGPDRENELGDLHNVEMDVEVIGGSGSVQVFVSSIDNGTGDSLLRTE